MPIAKFLNLKSPNHCIALQLQRQDLTAVPWPAGMTSGESARHISATMLEAARKGFLVNEQSPILPAV